MFRISSKEIFDFIYGWKQLPLKEMETIDVPGVYETDEGQYQKCKDLYLTLSEKLNRSLENDLYKRAAISTISQFLFKKRNVISINMPSEKYRSEMARSLTIRAPKFFSEIERLLKILEISCQPIDFDNAILSKIDYHTQKMASNEDYTYFDYKNIFFSLNNCSTPLDLLFRGLFIARAKMNVAKFMKIVFVISILIFILLIAIC